MNGDEECGRVDEQSTSLQEKRDKVVSNYETIEILRTRLEEVQSREKTGMTRAAYIKMIFDATKKVDKQNQELGKAVSETRQLQRSIRSLFGQLDQSLRQVEETILRESRGDVWLKECLRLLAMMHGSCDKLVHTVQETGDLTREIRQLEDQIGQLKVRQAINSS